MLFNLLSQVICFINLPTLLSLFTFSNCYMENTYTCLIFQNEMRTNIVSFHMGLINLATVRSICWPLSGLPVCGGGEQILLSSHILISLSTSILLLYTTETTRDGVVIVLWVVPRILQKFREKNVSCSSLTHVFHLQWSSSFGGWTFQLASFLLSLEASFHNSFSLCLLVTGFPYTFHPKL